MDLHYDQMCRTCMCKDANSQFLSIYEVPSENQEKPIIELLTSTTPQLRIQSADELPKTICRNCLSKLMEVHQFQQMCLLSETHMRGLLEHSAEEAKFTQVDEPSATPAVLEMQPSMYSGPDPLQDDDGNIAEVQDLLKWKSNNIEASRSADVVDSNVQMESKILEHEDTESGDGSIDESDDADWEANRQSKRHKKPITKQRTNSNDITKKEDDTSVSANKKKKLRSRLKKVPCPECGRKFRSMFHVKRHMGVHDKSKRAFPCLQCNYRFSTASNLKRHTSEIHNSKKPAVANTSSNQEDYKDDKCPPQTDQEDSLKTQGQNPVENVPKTELPLTFECDCCGKILKSRKKLANHKRIHKKENADVVKSHVCKYCQHAFHQLVTLEEHMRIHTGESPFLCSECGKVFNNASNLKQHLIRHAGVMRYQCPDCPKKFPCISDLGSHKAVHRKWKPHICDVCGAAFGKPCQLKKHKMYHTGEKPHKCEYCDMRFVCADHMRRHTRTHTGEKPYKCKYCDRAFGQSKDMMIHLRIHLGTNIYKCELCPRAFLKATEMREHFATHKNDDEETRQQNLNALMEDEVKLRGTLPSNSVSRKNQENQSKG